MITVQANSLKIQNPQYRQERIKNDLKYSWLGSAAAGTGILAGVAVYEDPTIIRQSYKRTIDFVKKPIEKFMNTPFGISIKENVAKAGKYVQDKATEFSKTGAFTKIKDKITPTLDAIKPKLANLKTQVLEIIKDGKKALDKIPAKYKAVGAVAIATLVLLANIVKNHAYNEGKIDAKYSK